MTLELQHNQERPANPTRPEGDLPIVPRSTTRLLTDEGIKGGGEQLAPLDTPTSEAAPQLSETEETLQALLEKHDAETASQNDEAPADAPAATDAPEGESSSEEDTSDQPPDFDKPELKAFADQFKQLMGIELKEAYETFVGMRDQYSSVVEQYNQLQQQQAQVEQQRTVDALKEDWGVNDAEFNRRITSVLDYASKLPEGLRQQLDNPEGIRLIWTQLSKRDTGASAKVGAQGTHLGGNTGGAPTFRKSELMKLMTGNPTLYSQMQAQISEALEAGRVIDDL